MEEDLTSPKKPAIHLVTSTDSPEFAHLTQALTRSSLVALDAEWRPLLRTHPIQDQPSSTSFPTVSLLQLAPRGSGDGDDVSVVFLLDLLAIPLASIHELLSDLFTCPDVLKLGFKFKQDLVYLSSTFCSHGCGNGFDRVEPYIDITSLYNFMRHKQEGRKMPKDSKSLAAICSEVLGITLSKELQCSDWSDRPLSEEQKFYAALDAHCLLEIFAVFQEETIGEGNPLRKTTVQQNSNGDPGLKEILVSPNIPSKIVRSKILEASEIAIASASGFSLGVPANSVISKSGRETAQMSVSISKIVRRYGDKIQLKECDRKPKISKKKGRKPSSTSFTSKEKQLKSCDDWLGPAPWDISLGGDGCPKFLCDVMVEGLAKHLRCVGIDAAVPYSKKPDARELLEQAGREKRILLTRDAKLLRHEYLLQNQIYKVKSHLKNDQLVEVIETFNLDICEDRLMSRCTKCNGSFIQRPLTTEEAVEAAKGFQIIPKCLFNKNLEFWQCTDCNQLYWEGTQYHNAVQKFVNICKLNGSNLEATALQ